MSTEALPPLTVQGRSHGLIEVARRRFLLSLLVRKELRVRYRASLLGLGWSYVKPAVMFGVYYVGMGLLLQQREIGNYALHLFAGLVVVTTFSEAVGNATRSILVNADLVRKIYLPRELFPVANVVVAGIHLGPQLVVLLVACLASGWRPDLTGLVAVCLSLVLVALLALGFSLLLAAVNVVFRDLENLVDLVLAVLVWTVPVLYPWQRVADLLGPDSWATTLYQSNPLTVAVELMHRGTWALASEGGLARMPDGMLERTVVAFVVATVIVMVGQLVFRRLSAHFAEQL